MDARFPVLRAKGTKMWCESAGDFMTAWGSHVRLCGGDTAYMILLFLLPRFTMFSKSHTSADAYDSECRYRYSLVNQRGGYMCPLFEIEQVYAMAALANTECLRVGLYLVWI